MNYPDYEKLKKGWKPFQAQILPGYTYGSGDAVILATGVHDITSFGKAEDLFRNLHKVANRAEAVAALGLEPERIYQSLDEVAQEMRKAHNDELVATVGAVAERMVATMVPAILDRVMDLIDRRLDVKTEKPALRVGPKVNAG